MPSPPPPLRRPRGEIVRGRAPRRRSRRSTTPSRRPCREVRRRRRRGAPPLAPLGRPRREPAPRVDLRFPPRRPLDRIAQNGLPVQLLIEPPRQMFWRWPAALDGRGLVQRHACRRLDVRLVAERGKAPANHGQRQHQQPVPVQPIHDHVEADDDIGDA